MEIFGLAGLLGAVHIVRTAHAVRGGGGVFSRPFGIFKDATNHWSSGQKHPTDQYPKRI